MDKVSNEVLRKEFIRLQQEQGLTASEIAIQMGWMARDNSPDVTRVRRVLGIDASNSNAGKNYHRSMIDWDQAGDICRAMGLWPVEVGL